MVKKKSNLELLPKRDAVPKGTPVGVAFRERLQGGEVCFLKVYTFNSLEEAKKKRLDLRKGALFFKMLYENFSIPFLPITLTSRVENGKFIIEMRRPIVEGVSLDNIGPELTQEQVAALDSFFEGFLKFFSSVLRGKQKQFWSDFENGNFYFGKPQTIKKTKKEKLVYPTDYDPEWILDYNKETMEQFFASFTQLLDSLRSFEKMAKSSNIDFVFLRSNKVLLKFIESIKRGKAKLTTSALEVLTPFIKLEE